MASKSNLEAWERSIGTNVIRAHRTRRGWSQRELAEALVKIGFTSMMHTTIAKIEAGTRPLRLAEFAGIAQAFGMPWASLMADVEPMLDPSDPVAEMQQHLATAQKIEDRAREDMLQTIDSAVAEYADAHARRITYASEYRRLSEGGGNDGSATDTSR